MVWSIASVSLVSDSSSKRGERKGGARTRTDRHDKDQGHPSSDIRPAHHALAWSTDSRLDYVRCAVRCARGVCRLVTGETAWSWTLGRRRKVQSPKKPHESTRDLTQ